MILKDNFYTIREIRFEADEINATIELNPAHKIFKGHFPGLPILPGVCMVQIQKELIEKELSRKIILKKATNIKFLSIINPLVINIINYQIKILKKKENIIISSKIYCNETIYFKMDCEYEILN